MNIAEIGKLIGEEVAKKPEICWYPGGFKPPHKGHLAAAQQLASKPYITQVKVLIGHGKRGGITAEQSKAIWDIYLKAQPNPKIVAEISQTKSPIKDLYRWFGDDLNREAYVAAAGKEADDLKYFKDLKEAFGDRVQEEIVDDQFVDSDGDRVSGTDFRATIAELRQRYLQVKNNPGDKKALNDYNTTYNYFKSLFPEAVIQKGYLDDIQRVLNINFPEPASLQEGNQPNPKKQPQWVWLEYKNQNKLNPIIFGNDNKVDPEVRELLLKIANYFWEGLEIPEPFEDILLTGSSVNYNYTPTSDIDLHIVIDFDKFENLELLKKYFDEAKVNWNRVHDLKLGKQNIEVYIQDNEDHPKYRGEYSLMSDKWLRKPSFVEIDIPDEEIEKKAKLFKQQIDKLEKTGKDDPEKAIELTDKIKERLKNFRQSGLDSDGEYSLENLAFKNLRNTGYLEKLNNLKNSFIDKTLSLVESVDKTSLFEKFMAYACNELQIHNPPTFEVRYEYGEDQPSFGAYVPSKHHISINPSNRNVVDVLRTLAHELVHAKQNEMGLLQPDSGETGSEHENDANAIAGILMRDYGKQNPNIYNIGMLNESINKTAGVWDTNEKFKDGSDFKIKFKVSDVIDLAKNTPVKKIDPKSINYDFSGREEDPTKTKDRVNKADLTYPIIVVKNEKGKIFAMLDGTHRLEKALNLGLNKIKTKILNKEDLIQFKTDKLNEPKQSNFNIKDIAQEFMSSKSYNKSDDCKISTYKFVNWLKTNKNINPDVLLLAPPKDIKKYPGKSKEGDSHIFTIINGNGIDFTANQFPGVSEPLKITPEAQIPSEYKRIGGYYTSTPDYFKNKTFIKDKFNNLPQWFHDGLKSSLNEAKQSNPPITRIYFDLDGVLAGFDEQFTKYNDEGLEFKEYIGKYGSSKAWDIINKGKEDFWAGMGWNPGGKQLYDSVVKLADKKGFEVWILSSPGLDPNGDAKRGKNKWLDKYTNIPQDRRVFKQAKDKHTEAKPGYMLIDDMGKNVSEFINAGGTGIKNNPEDSAEAIKKLYKFKYEQRNPTKKRIY
jgi:predicted nucleotidyltransferase